MKCVRFVRLLTRGTLRPASDIPDDPGLRHTQPGFAEHPGVGTAGGGSGLGAAILYQLGSDAVRCGDRGRPRSPDLRQRPRATLLFVRALSPGRRVPRLDERWPNRRDAVVEDGVSRHRDHPGDLTRSYARGLVGWVVPSAPKTSCRISSTSTGSSRAGERNCRATSAPARSRCRRGEPNSWPTPSDPYLGQLRLARTRRSCRAAPG